MGVCQNLVPLVNPKIAGKWMFIPLKMALIGIDPYPYNLLVEKEKDVCLKSKRCVWRKRLSVFHLCEDSSIQGKLGCV